MEQMSSRYALPSYARVFQKGWQVNNGMHCAGDAQTIPPQQVATAAPGGVKVKNPKRPGRQGKTTQWLSELHRFIPRFIPVNEDGFYIQVRILSNNHPTAPPY